MEQDEGTGAGQRSDHLAERRTDDTSHRRKDRRPHRADRAADPQRRRHQSEMAEYRADEIVKCEGKECTMEQKELLFVDMDGVLVDFYKGVLGYYPDFGQYEITRQREITAELSSIPGFFTSLEPIDGAVEAFRKLVE